MPGAVLIHYCPKHGRTHPNDDGRCYRCQRLVETEEREAGHDRSD